MTEHEQELKEKIVEILKKEIEYVVVCGSSVKNVAIEHIADALIAAGLTFDKTTAILAERTNRKTLILKAQYYDEMKHRAEVAKRALEHEIKNRINITGDVESLVYTYYGRAIYQAEKELAEEGKDD